MGWLFAEKQHNDDGSTVLRYEDGSGCVVGADGETQEWWRHESVLGFGDDVVHYDNEGNVTNVQETRN